jgi:Tol biopolymer transport system component
MFMKRQRQPYLTVLIFLGTFLTLTYGLTVLAYSPQRTDQIITNLERVSVNSLGEEGNNDSYSPILSADGRHVFFYSVATNLVLTDTNGFWGYDVFVHDRETGETIMVSINSIGEQGNDASTRPDISADGRYVVFESLATNLVISDTNNTEDVFLRDRQIGITTRVSVSSTGEQGNSYSDSASISADGRYIAFTSNANNLVASDTNNRPDIFVHDRITGVTERVSVNSQGQEGNYSSNSGRLSTDGRYIVFHSLADNLVPDDTDGFQDIFVHDRLTGQTGRVSISSLGIQGNAHSLYGDISATGRYVVFTSEATNLVTIPLNSSMNVFIHDRATGQTALVSQNTAGIAGNHWSSFSRFSGDERLVIFHSQASNLVSGDTNSANDVFVFEVPTGYILRVNTTPDGEQGNGNSGQGASDDTGKIVVFESEASNLVLNDANGELDVFVSEWQLFHIFLPAIFR